MALEANQIYDKRGTPKYPQSPRQKGQPNILMLSGEAETQISSHQKIKLTSKRFLISLLGANRASPETPEIDIQSQKVSEIDAESTPRALDRRVRRQAAGESQRWPREGSRRKPKIPNSGQMRPEIEAPNFEWEHEVGPH